MRVILASLAAAIAILTVSVSAQTASAQPGNPTRPYCLRDGINGAGMWDCSYYSMAAVPRDPARQRRLLPAEPVVHRSGAALSVGSPRTRSSCNAVVMIRKDRATAQSFALLEGV